MWPVSDAFTTAVATSHSPIIRVEVLDAGQVVASTDPVGVRDLAAVSGGVDADRRAPIRRSAQITLVDPDGRLTPVVAGDLLNPASGREFRLWRGIRLGDGDELVPLGVFGIETCEISETADGVTINLGGRDRMARLDGIEWVEPYTIAAGADPNDALVDLATVYLGAAPATNLTAIDAELNAQTFGVEGSASPLDALHKIASAAGLDVFFDQLGRLTTIPTPDASTSPVVWRLTGDRSIRLGDATRRIDRATLRNGVRVISNHPDLEEPLVAEAWDEDPQSPYRYVAADPTTHRPEEIQTTLPATQAQTQAMADARLRDWVGIEEDADFVMLPHPAFDVGDVVEVSSPVFRGRTQRLMVEALRCPLPIAETMPVRTRRRRR